METLGNAELLKQPKVGFLAASHVPSAEVMPCYDWAIRQAEAGNCVVSGFSSRMERDVLRFLLRGKSPVIVVLARRLCTILPDGWQRAINEGRMLVISISTATRQSRRSAAARNQYVAELCDTLLMAGVTEHSSLSRVRQQFHEKTIEIAGGCSKMTS